MIYGSDDPTSSVTALKDNGQSTRSRANLSRLSSLIGKVRNVTKCFNTSSSMKIRHRGTQKIDSSLKGKEKDVSKKNLIHI